MLIGKDAKEKGKHMSQEGVEENAGAVSHKARGHGA